MEEIEERSEAINSLVSNVSGLTDTSNKKLKLLLDEVELFKV